MSPTVKSPVTAVTPACKSETVLRASASRAPSSTVTDPVACAANAIHNLRAVSSRCLGKNCVPASATLFKASTTTFARFAEAITVRTPDQEAIRAAASFDAMPPLPRVLFELPARTERSSSSASTVSIKVAFGSTLGSAVNNPFKSVSKINTSAETLWATSAAIRSLSPNRISSLAIASFSFITGTQPSSSNRTRVWRACRY